VTASKPRPCSQCHERVVCENVTVRVYRRRSQYDFRYVLCEGCRLILYTILRENAMSIQRGAFVEDLDK